MKKKILLIAFFALSIAVFLVLKKSPDTTEGCAFCKERVIEKQKFYEDDLVLALYSHKPIVSGHTLIIPKRHV